MAKKGGKWAESSRFLLLLLLFLLLPRSSEARVAVVAELTAADRQDSLIASAELWEVAAITTEGGGAGGPQPSEDARRRPEPRKHALPSSDLKRPKNASHFRQIRGTNVSYFCRPRFPPSV